MTDLRSKLVAALSQDGSASSDFDLNPGLVLPQNRVLKPSAVLVCVRLETQSLILTKRSNELKHHPGQIAFPGGKMDADDPDLNATALREAEEEIGLPRQNVEILGALPSHETVTGYEVTPILACLDTDFETMVEVGEVSEVFEVPLDLATNSSRFRIEGRRWQGHMRRYYVVPFGPDYIWGATARILRGLADRVAA